MDKPDDPASSNSSSRSVTPVHVHVVDDDKGNKSVRKKRKRSSEKVNKMEELVEKVLKMQDESQQHYLKMEQKLLEMEECRQKESREFHLQMMSLLCSQQYERPPLSGSGEQYPRSFPTYHPMYSFLPRPLIEDVEIANNPNS